MHCAKKENSKFPKDFFTKIKLCKPSNSNNPNDFDKPFKWSKNVLNGSTKIKLTIVKSTKN